jgi:hypothetical protein
MKGQKTVGSILACPNRAPQPSANVMRVSGNVMRVSGIALKFPELWVLVPVFVGPHHGPAARW